MVRALCTGVALVTALLLQALPALPAPAGTGSGPRAIVTIPSGNVASSGPVLDDRYVVYGAAVPRNHPPVCVSCGQRPFTDFHVQVYARAYGVRAGSIAVSQPRLLFTGPRGAQVVLYAAAAGWLVYDTDATNDRWQLFARNLATGRVILLDAPRMEGVPSRFLHAGTDGRTVVWQSWTRLHGQTTSVIRSYTLATGRRQLLLSGGTGTDFFYGYPQISGDHLILVRDPGSTPSSQILVENLATHHLRALTSPGQSNFEPSISGDIVVWVHGSLTAGHAHGLVVANLVTGRRVALERSSSQLPRVIAGRYVVFAPDYSTPYPKGEVQVYDALTGRRRTILSGPDASGFVPNWTVEAGGSAALVRMDKPCGTPNSVCPSYFVLIPIAPR